MGRASRNAGRTRCLWEALEPRVLLSGVTIITHGYESSGTFPNWVATMAQAVAAREGGASIYRMVIGHDGSSHVQFQSFTPLSGPDPRTSANGEVVIELDWSSDSTLSLLLAPKYTTTQVASVVVPYLLGNVLTGLGGPAAQLPLQLIGHSRGGSLISEMARLLGQAGVWVDQMTTLDPHPVSPDPTAAPTNNVVFADNYYQTTGSLSDLFTTGSPVTGAYNLNITSVDASHSGVHAYYDGTVDLSATTDGDGITISPTWYAAPMPARPVTGYYYSRIVGGNRPPAGMGAGFGGSGSRVADAAVGAQWANIGALVPAATTALTGQTLHITFQFEDRDSAASVQWYLDPDQNPYDGNEILLGAALPMAATGDAVGNYGVNYIPSLGQVGTYYLAAVVSDGTHARVAYAAAALTIRTPGAVGDANLDGLVDQRDYRIMDASYVAGFDGTTGHRATWANGDFNGDGIVDGADYALINQAYLVQHPGAAVVMPGVVSVPLMAGGAIVPDGAQGPAPVALDSVSAMADVTTILTENTTAVVLAVAPLEASGGALQNGGEVPGTRTPGSGSADDAADASMPASNWHLVALMENGDRPAGTRFWDLGDSGMVDGQVAGLLDSWGTWLGGFGSGNEQDSRDRRAVSVRQSGVPTGRCDSRAALSAIRPRPVAKPDGSATASADF